MHPSSSEALRIRPGQPGDEAALLQICLLTGDGGGDATPLFEDPDLIGLWYAAPYLHLPSTLAFVAEDEAGVAGYIVGAIDSRLYHQAFVREWAPRIARRFPDPPDDRPSRTQDDDYRRRFHHPEFDDPPWFESHPSHLHIDLLPRLQGRGIGRRLMDTFLDALTSAGSGGVHLGVGASNHRARRFYRRYGFTELEPVDETTSGSVSLGLCLPRPSTSPARHAPLS
ncbi:MAG: GNAT family N-acetyltransferase [Puniceicoccaceae bacterium]|nr:MAG: GNAT family N-acetyltransferase [Puniceicoccaceae bacterium]